MEKQAEYQEESNVSVEMSRLRDYILSDMTVTYNFNSVTPEIFVFGSLEYESCVLYNVICEYLDHDFEKIDKFRVVLYDELMSSNQFLKAKRPKVVPTFNKKLSSLIEKAEQYKELTKSKVVTSGHVLFAMLNVPSTDECKIKELISEVDGVTFDITRMEKTLKSVDSMFKFIVEEPFGGSLFDNESDVHNTYDEDDVYIPKTSLTDDKYSVSFKLFTLGSDGLKEVGKSKTTNTNSKEIPFCSDLSKMASGKKLGTLIGRKNEVASIMKVLCKKDNNNVILVGDAGVGKTQIVYGVASAITEHQCPTQLKDKHIYMLNISEIVSDAKLVGMLEGRFAKLTKALHNNSDSILVIDNIHYLTANGKESSDMLSLLSDIMLDDNVRVIATTTHKGFKNLFTNGNEFEQKFHKLTIDKPTHEETIEIINGLLYKYENFHGVKYNKDLIGKCVELSDRYITDKNLPSSAINMIDEAGVTTKLRYTYGDDVYKLNEELNNLTLQLNLVQTDGTEAEARDIEDKIKEVKKQLAHKERKDSKKTEYEVTLDDLYSAVSDAAGVPLTNINSFDIDSLKEVPAKLKACIIGQDRAIDTVTKAIQKNRLGLSNKNKPILSALFTGNRGCGKTLLAKQLAEKIFGDEKYLIRFDMSEYADETSVNKLIGASAGYVGYNEGGLLTEAVKQRKYAVLLIDEIEKANQKVFNLFLQVLDEGFLTDNTGVKVDFKNTIIIMTSNVGAKQASDFKGVGYVTNDTLNKKDIVEKCMKKKFAPEFLNRIDSIIQFNQLTEDDYKKIVNLELNKFKKKLVDNGFDFAWDDEVVDYIYEKVKEDTDYGARPILRVIKDEIENDITDMIIDKGYTNHNFNSFMVNGNIIFIE